MKATGIVRRVDDLGRVVIPKEIMHLHRAICGGFSLVSKNNHYLYICAENDKISWICEQFAVTYYCKKLSYMLYVKMIDCFGRLSKCQN